MCTNVFEHQWTSAYPFPKPRKSKLLDAKKRFEERNGGNKRFSEVKEDYSNLEPSL